MGHAFGSLGNAIIFIINEKGNTTYNVNDVNCLEPKEPEEIVNVETIEDENENLNVNVKRFTKQIKDFKNWNPDNFVDFSMFKDICLS